MSKKIENTKNELIRPVEDEVSKRVHTIVVLVLLISICIVALSIDDLTVLFGIIGAFSEAVTNFILPGLFIYMTANKLN